MRTIWSSHSLKRLNKKIQHRTNVVGIFSNNSEITPQVGSQLLERQEEWRLDRLRFFSQDAMAKIPEPETPLELSSDAPAEQIAATMRAKGSALASIYTNHN